MTRPCARCARVLPLSEFPRSRSKPLGRGYACRACERERAAQRRRDNPEAVAAAKARHAEKHPESGREATRRYRQRNPERNYRPTPEQRRARQAVYRAVRRGRLVRPDACSRCGRGCKPHAHHDDYARPLEVEWLCASCHKRTDLAHAA